jgi:hypothetical protein
MAHESVDPQDAALVESVMTEFELKLEIPPERLPAVLVAMREDKTRRKRLQARYFDTKEEALAREGIVLRLRREGRAAVRWSAWSTTCCWVRCRAPRRRTSRWPATTVRLSAKRSSRHWAWIHSTGRWR